MEIIQKREAEENSALENMILQVEANLEATTVSEDNRAYDLKLQMLFHTFRPDIFDHISSTDRFDQNEMTWIKFSKCINQCWKARLVKHKIKNVR